MWLRLISTIIAFIATHVSSSVIIFVTQLFLFFSSLLSSKGLPWSLSLILIVCLQINFYYYVYRFIFPSYFIFYLIFVNCQFGPSWHVFSSLFNMLIDSRGNSLKHQVQRSLSVHLVLSFNMIYFRAIFMEVFSMFIWCWFFIFEEFV